MNILILGSSGFIGTNLTKKLMSEGHHVIGMDIELPKYVTPHQFIRFDLRVAIPRLFINKFDEVYVLGCLMGGMGFIGDEKKHGYDITVGSTQILTNSIEFIKKWSPKAKVFYSSSACVYNQDLQTKSVSLKESDMIPANPDLAYGWQKLFGEKMFIHSGLDVRIARFHNIFGELGTYDGGKEKAPGAICRKVAMAKDGDEIEVWGTGSQTRSFLYIDRCLYGVSVLMNSEFKEPINIGSDEIISINDLAKMVIGISGKSLTIKNISGNVGVNGRNSDNTLCADALNWRPNQKLIVGMTKLYHWVNKQING